MKRWGAVGLIVVLYLLSMLPGMVVSCSPVVVPSETKTPVKQDVQPLLPASVKITPQESYNPVMTQHTATAQVLTSDGKPVPEAIVIWILNRFPQAVGDIVSTEVALPDKQNDNSLATTRTDTRGESRVTITSTRPGDTDLTAYVPAIADTSVHKTFATKHWLNMQVQWPEDAKNVVGTSHTFTTKVMSLIKEAQLPGYPAGWTSVRTGVGEGLPGYNVRWTIVDDDPPLYFVDGTSTTKTYISKSDASGAATATIKQVKPARGENTLKAEVLAPDGVPMFTQQFKKTWIAPLMDITKTGTTEAMVGAEVSYKITVRNSGDADSNGVKIVDVLPDGLKYVRSEPAGTLAGNQITWDVGTVRIGTSTTVNVFATALRSGQWTDTARATSADGAEGEASVTTKVAAPAVEISKTGPAARYIQQNGDYAIQVKNSGDVVLNGVTVTDQIPEGMSFVSASPEGVVSGKTVTWNIGTMNPGESRQYKISLRCDQKGTWSNTATITSKEGAKATAEAKTLVVAVAGVTISSTDSIDPIAVGESTSYIVTVRNQGKIDVHNLVIEDVLPPQTNFISAKGPSTYKLMGSNRVTFDPVPLLTTGQTLTYEITVNATTKGSVINRATMTYTEFGEPVAVEEGTTIFKVE